VQAHTLGEVGNLGTVSLRVSSGTILPIFIEIGSYLTDKEQKISWHSFFETRCILCETHHYSVNRRIYRNTSTNPNPNPIPNLHITVLDNVRRLFQSCAAYT